MQPLSDRNLSERNFSGGKSFEPNVFGSHSAGSTSFGPHVPQTSILKPSLDPVQPVGRLEALASGAAYLEQVRKLAPAPDMIACLEQPAEQAARASWIGRHVEAINRRLRSQLANCEACFYPVDRPAVTILAAPLAAQLKLDGLCHLGRQPVVLLIDVGRLAPPDWLGAVAHEYAHAVVGSPGHDGRFQQVLSHLCLGLGLPSPPASNDRAIAGWPPSRPTEHPAAFWQGGRTGESSAF